MTANRHNSLFDGVDRWAVLLYLLIVIAVMGAIAATLMTSTVQVMAAQQNSIRYMQDKYEAMGEVEKLVAELESIDYIYPMITY